MFDKTKKNLRIYMIVAMASIILLITVGFIIAIYFVNENSEKEALQEILKSEVLKIEGKLIEEKGLPPIPIYDINNKMKLQKNDSRLENNQEKNPLFLGANPRRMYMSLLVENDGSVNNFKINLPFEENDNQNFDELIELVKDKENGKILYDNDYYIFDSEITSRGRIYVFVDSTMNKKFINTTIAIGMLVTVASVIYIGLLSIKITNKALYPLKLSVESQLRFSSDASHELRTPLTAMRANMDILMEYDDLTADEQKNFLSKISSEIDRMSKLTNDLLKLSRNNTVEHEMKNFEVLNLVEYIDFMYKNICELEFNVENFDIYGNEEDLKQLLIIFIDNGLKYNNNENKKIKLCIVEKERHYIFKIEDNGEGIKEENYDKIFERFFREDKSRSSNQSGLGLGLSIAKNIINSYDGKIKVNSAINKYTEFVIIFPKKRH